MPCSFCFEGIISYLISGPFFAPVYFGTICAQNSGVIYTKWDPLCPSYSGVIFSTRVGPSVPKICRGDFSPKRVHLHRRYFRVIFST